MYHPLHLLLYRALPFTAAFNLELFLSYPLMLWGMFLLLRRWSLVRSAAIFGALVFTFSGFNLLHFMHMHAVAVIAHTPWLLLAIDILMRGVGRRRAGMFAAVAALTASQVLLGFPQSMWFSIIAEILYILLLIPFRRPVVKVSTLAAAKIAGVLIGAVQILPTWDQVHNSVRLTGEVFKSGMFSLEKVNILQLVGPYLFENRVVASGADVSTHEFGLYNGAAALLLMVVLACIIGKVGRSRRLGIGALAVTALALLLALGENGPFWPLVVRLPLVSMFRASTRYVVLVHLAMAVGAAVAFDYIVRLRKTGGTLGLARLSPLAVIVVASLAAVAVARRGDLAPFAQRNVFLTASGVAIVAAGAVLVAAAARGKCWALAGLVLFTALDQGLYGLSYVHKKRPETLARYIPKASLPVDSTYYRIERSPAHTNSPILAGYRLSNGFVSFPPTSALDYTKTAALRVAGVKWRIVRIENADERGRQEFRVYEVSAPMPRVRLVSKAVVAEDPNDALERIDISESALVAESVDLQDGPPGEATITRDAPGDVTIEVASSTRQLLVFAERFHEGWHVSIDGRPERIVRVYGDFMGCVVEAGAHEVRFVFRPASLHLGRRLSIAGLALAAVLVALYGFLDRRRARAARPSAP
jgi:hypothetical protein